MPDGIHRFMVFIPFINPETGTHHLIGVSDGGTEKETLDNVKVFAKYDLKKYFRWEPVTDGDFKYPDQLFQIWIQNIDGDTPEVVHSFIITSKREIIQRT